jgi:hypothetical protein
MYGNDRQTFPTDENIVGHPKDKVQIPQQVTTSCVGNIHQRRHYNPLPSLTAKPQQEGKT